MKRTHVRTIQELVEAGILGALHFQFTILMADLGYDTPGSFELNDSAPATAKELAETFQHVYRAFKN